METSCLSIADSSGTSSEGLEEARPMTFEWETADLVSFSLEREDFRR